MEEDLKAKDPKKPKKKKKKKKNSSPGKRGRKSLYELLDIGSILDSIRGWAKEGSTDEELWTMLGVSKDTFYKWKKEIPEFSESVKRGKDFSNGELLNSAFKQATGYYVPVMEVVKIKRALRNPDGSILLVAGKPVLEEEAVAVPTEQYVAPNSTMGIFMVKNRLPEKYKDKHEVEHTGKVKLEDFMGEE